MLRVQTGLALLICLLITVGCGRTDTESKSPSATTAVSLGLNWYPEAEHGGFFAAEVHDFYASEGLQVTIRPGGPNVPIMQQVARGDVLFGVTNADQLLLARAQGMPLVAVMAPLQDSPRAIMVHRSSGITEFDQLQNMTLAMSAGAAWAQFLRDNLAFENVKFVPPGSVAQFLNDPNFGQQAYVFSEPFVAESQGGDPYCLMVSDLGFNPYTSVLFCHADTIRDQPEMVRNMVSASIRGWEKYLELSLIHI